MGRMTICRSNAALLVAAGFLLCPALRAQDTTQVTQADTTQVAPAAAQGQAGGVHTVATGETLWSISQLYFGDPLLWPEIYRLNTAVIEDPHWIYPGEQLNLAPMMETIAQGPDVAPADTTAPVADTVRAAPSAADTVTGPVDAMPPEPVIVEEPPPPPTEIYRTMFEQERTRTQQVQDVLRAYTEQPYRPVRRGEFYSAGWLSEEEKLPWAEVLGNTVGSSVPRIDPRTSAIVTDEIAVIPPKDASYHVGDSLLLARIDRRLVDWGDVVVPVGIARVTAVEERQVKAKLLTQYARVREGRLALPLEPFKDPGAVRPAAVAQGLEAKVIGKRDVHAIVNSQEQIFIDKGRADGVTPGDIFEVYRGVSETGEEGSEQVRVTLLIIHTREHTSTGLVVVLNHPGVTPGMVVRLVRKMPS